MRGRRVPRWRAASRDWVPTVGLLAMTAYPFLRFVANNLGFTIHVDVLVVWTLVLTGLAFVIVALVAKIQPGSSRRVAVILIPLLWLIFNYQMFALRSPHPLQLWIVMALAAVGVAVIASRWDWFRATAATWAVLLVVAQVIPVIAYSPEPLAISEPAPVYGSPDQRPNVWVFIPDGYTSPHEVLRQTGVDVSTFVEQLHERGFSTPETIANYPRTFLSVSSMLDQRLLAGDGLDVQERKPFYERIQGDNRTVEQFREWGYDYVFSTTSTWEGSLCSDWADTCITGEVMDRTSQALLTSTPFEPVVDISDDIQAAARFSDPAYVVDSVFESHPEEPYLVVSHLMEPHPPGFHTADCEVREDTSIAIHNSQWNAHSYRESVQCLNQRFVEAVDHILATDPDPIIVIQGDHGTRLGDTESQRYKVLSALRLPCDVPDTLGVVDVMRVTTACVADEEPDLVGQEIYEVDEFVVEASTED